MPGIAGKGKMAALMAMNKMEGGESRKFRAAEQKAMKPERGESRKFQGTEVKAMKPAKGAKSMPPMKGKMPMPPMKKSGKVGKKDAGALRSFGAYG